MKKYIKNERGNGMLLVIVGMLIASIFISFMFFDFFNVFISKRISQTSADAAVLAAAKEARLIYEERYTAAIESELEDLRELFDDEKEKAETEEEEGDEEEEEPPPDEESLLDSIIKEIEIKYREVTMPPSLRDWLEDPDAEVDPVEALKYFYEEDELNEMACTAISSDLERIRKAADEYARKNGADRNVQVEFDQSKFSVFVESEKDGSYVTADDSLFDGIDADASATIKRPKGLDIGCD
ncbi:hypothetical protein ACJROX_02095 [Pseudalkalibacillus sp. A8]|uniref:hypothetical protein n=1 Tax=Pseudalkalibacillus sp. A8 TaxID=3382641 RepID=UPI0038B5B628